MTIATQGYGSPPGYDAANLFNSGSKTIANENNFFKAFGSAQTNKMTANESAPQNADLNLNTTDPSFFDFDGPSRPVSPFSNQYSPHAAAGNMPGWASDMNLHPLSPPNSAPLEAKGWDFMPAYPQPPNIMTNMPSANVRSQFGQVTPPDDENEGEFPFDRPIREQDGAHAPSERPSETASGKKRNRLSASSSKDSPAKRSRKYTSRNSGSSNASGQPTKTEDVRRSKFLERNRVAASKCRQKKKEWTQNLESRARDMQKENGSLHMMVDSLRQEVIFLKGEMLRHGGCDCTQIQEFLKNAGPGLTDSIPQSRPDRMKAIDLDNDDTESVTFKQENSPFDSPASDNDDMHLDEASVSGESRYDDDDSNTLAERKAIAEDENALEALLTNELAAR